MNILFIKHFFVDFMICEIQRMSVFGHYPYSVTFSYNIESFNSLTEVEVNAYFTL